MAALLAHAGVKGRRIRELTSVVQKRFKFPEGSVELYAEKVSFPTAAQPVTTPRPDPAATWNASRALSQRVCRFCKLAQDVLAGLHVTHLGPLC